MFLECRLEILDPLQRNLELQDVLGVETRDKWHVDKVSGEHYLSTMKTFVELHGKNGVLTRLNQLGLFNKTTGKAFVVLSNEERQRQIRESMCTVL